MINMEILNEYFIWEENNSTELQKNCENNNESVHYDTTTEIKTDSTLKDWRDITDPKLRRKMYNKEYNKKYKEKNKESLLAKSKTYYENNKDKVKLRSKTRYEVNKDKERLLRRERSRTYYEDNKDKERLRAKIYLNNNKEKRKVYRNDNKEKIYKQRLIWIQKNKNNPQYKLSCILRSRLKSAIKNNYKSGSAVRDLGCSVSELKVYLESKFQPGMTWNNWSIDGWHIDHIKPLSSFDLTDRKLLLEACHYTNLQPMWAKDNIIKRDKLLSNFNPSFSRKVEGQ